MAAGGDITLVRPGRVAVFLLRRDAAERDQTDVAVAKLLARNPPGARGKDLWLLARAFGDRSLFPVVPGGLRTGPGAADTSISSLVNGTPVTSSGAYPLAFTNALFVDVDGGGWRAPFQP